MTGSHTDPHTGVRTGLEVLIGALNGEPIPPGSASADLLRIAELLGSGARCGLVSNPSSVTREMVGAQRALDEAGVKIAALFGPEHGARGAAAAGEKVPTARDATTGIPVFSLYGPTTRPTPEMLSNLDVVLFDLQDVGVRFYTFTWTLSLIMEACVERGIPVVILDRPNPIGGVVVEGPVLEPSVASFVGRYPIPLRHGLSSGELGRLFAAAYCPGVEVLVATMDGWRRKMTWEQTGLEWAAPSPNIPTVRTCWIYPATCLLEGTNLSEGRGTALPFVSCGAPWIDPERLATALRERTGSRWRPIHFTPSSSKHDGVLCGGVEWHPPLDPEWRSGFRAVPIGLQLLAAVKELWPKEFRWLEDASGRSHFDRLIGRSDVRRRIDRGEPVESITASWENEDSTLPDRRLYD